MKQPSLPIDHATRPWLLLAAALATLPHLEHQPAWLGALLVMLLLAAGHLWRSRGELPRRWQLLLLVGVGCAGTLYEYHTLFGRDAGVALLIIFMALKLFETRSRRDATVLLTLGYFLLLTQYFYSQTLLVGGWLMLAMGALTATLVRLHGAPETPVRQTIRQAALLIAQALPFMLILFVLFPRISGPLWGLPSDAFKGGTGLSDSMAPGTLSDLVQNPEIAFRVRFLGPLPPRQKLYWRGPVLEDFDGRTWRPERRRRPAERIEPQGPVIDYETTLEPHQQRWLLALDAPLVEGRTDFALNGTLTAEGPTPINQRQRFTLRSAPDFRHNVDELPGVLRRNLQLPPGNPRTRALASEWRTASPTPQSLVARALTLFGGSDFAYTLRPPLLGGDIMDDFLFNSRRGFCEHYAAAFVFLMRAAGVPARVVTGYQGGELNPVDGFLVVRQYDAHAWAEIWIEGRGWLRIDPTAVVSPARIDEGLGRALPEGEPLPALLQVRGEWLRGLRHQWEALNNAWNQYVLGYSPQRQREFLQRLGLPADWTVLAGLLGAACALTLGLVAAWTLYQRPSLDPAQRLWRKALTRLARSRVNCAPADTPAMLLARVTREHPALAPAFGEVVDAYLRARYGDEPDQLARLRRAIALLPNRRIP